MKSHKKIAISPQNQITIPKELVKTMGFEKYVFLEVEKDYLIIKPVKEVKPEIILEQLIERGLKGNDLINSFKEKIKENKKN